MPAAVEDARNACFVLCIPIEWIEPRGPNNENKATLCASRKTAVYKGLP
jgi:hypothetical protein